MYRRQLCRTPDGGTIALDWLHPSDCVKSGDLVSSSVTGSSDVTRTVVVVPGLTSDSADAYVKHIAYSLAASGWRVVVANHRGLGGVSITSNQFYNAAWTEDLRSIINHLYQADPKTSLLAVGTSIGANILVKYLGEEGENTPLGGAAAICNPWDLLVCDRFICRTVIQRLYDKVLAFGLRSYAQLHQVAFSRIADWDLISKSCSIRDFDNHCTRVVGQYETVDTYYRKSSSAYHLHSVSIPLFCISSLDDPVCTKEAIPWDECRVNANVVLGLTRHGGHLAFFEGLTATSIWWVRATTEFLENLCASSLLHVQKHVPVPSSGLSPILENVVDKSPYLSISQNGVAAAEEVSIKDADKPDELIAEDDHRQEGLQVDVKASTKPSAELSPGYEFAYGFHDPHQENANAEKVQAHSLAKTLPDTDSQASSSTCSDIVIEPYHQTLKLCIRDRSELLTLESTLSQLLEQVETFKRIVQKEKGKPVFSTNMQREVGNNSDCEEWPNSRVQVRVPAGTRTLPIAGNCNGEHGGEGGHGSSNNKNLASADAGDGTSVGHDDKRKLGVPVSKGIKVIARQNGRALWLLAYIAIVTTWPLVGSALFLSGRRRLKKIVTKYWPR